MIEGKFLENEFYKQYVESLSLCAKILRNQPDHKREAFIDQILPKNKDFIVSLLVRIREDEKVEIVKFPQKSGCLGVADGYNAPPRSGMLWPLCSLTSQSSNACGYLRGKFVLTNFDVNNSTIHTLSNKRRATFLNSIAG